MFGKRLFSFRRGIGVAVVGLATLGVFQWCDRAGAQPQVRNPLPNPRLFTVTPCGAKAGTTVEISWTGTDLEEPQAFLFSHTGIKATAVIPPPPKPDPKIKPDPKKPEPPPPPITKFSVQ